MHMHKQAYEYMIRTPYTVPYDTTIRYTLTMHGMNVVDRPYTIGGI